MICRTQLAAAGKSSPLPSACTQLLSREPLLGLLPPGLLGLVASWLIPLLQYAVQCAGHSWQRLTLSSHPPRLVLAPSCAPGGVAPGVAAALAAGSCCFMTDPAVVIRSAICRAQLAAASLLESSTLPSACTELLLKELSLTPLPLCNCVAVI